jgi:hypothetical protein
MVKRNCDQAYNMTFIKSNIKQHNELSLRTWHVLINYIKQHNKVEAIDPAQGNNIYMSQWQKLFTAQQLAQPRFMVCLMIFWY